MNTSSRRRLIAAFLISGLLPFLCGARESQCGRKVPDTFNYPQSQETIQLDAEIKSRSLSGVVTDPSGAVARVGDSMPGFSVFASAPEPSVFALTSMSGLALLLFRRRR